MGVVVVEEVEAGIVEAAVAKEVREVVVARRRGVVAAGAGQGNKKYPLHFMVK